LLKKWLQAISTQVTAGDEKKEDFALNIAFSFEGLKLLGLNKDVLESFPIELEDGMTTKHKQYFLGDHGASDPANWTWGGKKNDTVHVLLMLYAIDPNTLQALYDKQIAQLTAHELYVIEKLDTSVLYERKEHFGFHDGISQPTIKGLSKTDDPENMVAAGEFILGYKNEYNQYTSSPSVTGTHEKTKMLPVLPSEPARYDLGKNGTYVVFRQMTQDVELFWKYMEKCTLNEKGESDEYEMIKLAAKMVGRWPGGAPVVICPDKESKEHNNTNKFAYRKTDSAGLMCPYASHVRRSNPRDALDTNRATSIKVANKHRILRRGRSYGQPVTETMNPQDNLKAKDIKGERGMHFICLNADIGRQFEFIQTHDQQSKIQWAV
jgi:deferrochelatase/peroxidase EfeB